jgi:hypothetical protein
MLLECLQQQNRTEEAKELIQTHSEELIAQAESSYIDGDQNTAATGWGAYAFMDLQDPAALSQSPNSLEFLISVYRRNHEMSHPIPGSTRKDQGAGAAQLRWWESPGCDLVLTGCQPDGDQ